MTVSSTVRRNDYASSGITGPYAYTFRIFDAADLRVSKVDASGTETVLTYATDYTVSNVGNRNGGSVTLTTAIPSGYTIIVQRVRPFTQETDFRNQGPFFAEMHEDALDNLVMIAQQLSDQIMPTFRAPSTVNPASLNLEIPGLTPNSYLRVNNGGNGLEAVTNVVASQSFLQSGTGAVTRTMNAKAADVLDVRDFNAKCDGVTDDTAAIHATIVAAGAGGRITGPSGATSVLASELVLPFGVQWVAPGFCLKVSGSPTQMISMVDPSDLLFYGIIFDGNLGTKCLVSLVTSGANGSNIVFDACTFRNTVDSGPLYASYGAIRHTAALGAATTFRPTDITIRNSVFHSLGSMAATLGYVDRAAFEGNIVNSSPFHGMEFVGCTYAIGRNNRIRNCTQSAIGVGGATSYFDLSGNLIENCAGDGCITVEGTSVYGLVSRNVLAECNAAGVNVSYTSGSSAPNDRTQLVRVAHNVIRSKSSVVTFAGVNAYSTVSGGLPTGLGIEVEDNTFDGFNIGVTPSYLAHSSVRNNRILNLSGSASALVVASACQSMDIEHNRTNSTTGGHAIQLVTAAGVQCDSVSVTNNRVFQAGSASSKAVVYIEGTGSFDVHGNKTEGATNWVNAAANCLLSLEGNRGLLIGAEVGGAGSPTIVQSTGNWSGLTDFVVVQGRRQIGGTTAPASGAWAQGDYCKNTAPSVGNPKGWYCTVTGTPGTWVSEGNL